jgi:small subunit ribosomal protein S2
MVDTNSDPKPIDYPIPANDDASKSIQLIVNTMCQAIKEGLAERSAEKDVVAEKGDNQEVNEDAPKRTRARKSIAKANNDVDESDSE